MGPYGKLEYCWKELLWEVMSFENRMRHYEENKEQIKPYDYGPYFMVNLAVCSTHLIARNGVFPH